MEDRGDNSRATLLDETHYIFHCPGCGGDLAWSEANVTCLRCEHVFAIEDGIPMLFWPNDWGESNADVTETVKAFYEDTPFPNYDDFDSIASLQQKASAGLFARLLDQQVPLGARVLEVGCGTGQLSNFLSIANRSVFASDICLNSLRLGQGFARDHGLPGVQFVQQNLFKPIFKPESFDLVVSNGVLHHTSDPFLAFETISRLVKPGGYLLVGLYHRYGRLITDFRRKLFNLSGDRFKFLDPNLRRQSSSTAKKQAWFADQYKHPHESKHTIGETIGWLGEIGFDFVTSLPYTKPFQDFSADVQLFEPAEPGNGLECLAVELGMIFEGSREGGFFIVIGCKPE
jgi:ubiquinone/menaquinone biosynthesis C-methylase UbiE/uncharacterized protein YbaR (Trm112 family)